MSGDGHLFVIIHGLWGGPHHVSVIEKVLKETCPDDNIYTLIPKGSAFFRTYDGIKHWGDLVLDELFGKLIELNDEEHVKITRISFVGYSLGGLISRYCIGELTKLDSFFDLIKPTIFTTFVTPHLGVKFFDKSVPHFVLNTLGTHLLGQTGRDLFIADRDRLVEKLIEPEGPYYKGLAKFEKRIMFANIKNDRTVPFYTSFVTRYNPFLDWDNTKLKYLEHAPEVLIDDRPYKPRIVDLHRSTRLKNGRVHYTKENVGRYVLVLLVVMFILPVWLPLVFVASLFGTLQSAVRLWFAPAFDIQRGWKDVLSKRTGSAVSKSAPSADHPIEEEFAELTETYVEGVLAAGEGLHGDKTDAKDEESTDESEQVPVGNGSVAKKDKTTTTHTASWPSSVNYDLEKFEKFVQANEVFFKENHYNDIAEFSTSEESALVQKYPLFDVPSVAIKLDSTRDRMVQNFNSLPIVKVPVFIDSFNAHDGIISRRGIKTSPRGTATILLWCTILKQHFLEAGSS